jgi:hypothetical protein
LRSRAWRTHDSVIVPETRWRWAKSVEIADPAGRATGDAGFAGYALWMFDDPHRSTGGFVAIGLLARANGQGLS